MKREELIVEARRLKKKADEIEFFASTLDGDHQEEARITFTAKVRELRQLQSEYEELSTSLPPAEGAEEIDELIKKHIMINAANFEFCVRNNIITGFLLQGIRAAATLHAQRIAAKMVEDECTNHVEQLKEFHTAFGLPQRNIPTIMPSDEFKSRQNLLEEEVDELSTAYENGDIIEIADAITDCLYVLIGTALQFGIADALDEYFDEVHKSNMSKLGLDGKPIVREDGKVMKGPNFRRPELYRILKLLSHDR